MKRVHAAVASLLALFALTGASAASYWSPVRAAAPQADVVFAQPVVVPSGADPVSGDPAVAGSLGGAVTVGWRNQSSSAIYANSDEIPGGPFSGTPYTLGSPAVGDLRPA